VQGPKFKLQNCHTYTGTKKKKKKKKRKKEKKEGKKIIS
jgi:hypothetical protein